MEVYLSFLFSLSMGLVSAHFAQKRGKSANWWFVIGFLFSFLGVLALFLLPKPAAEPSDKRVVKPEVIPPQAPYVPDPRSREWFYVDKSDQRQGPVPYRTLLTAWQGTRIGAESFVWTEGMAEWQRIKEIPSLLERLQ